MDSWLSSVRQKVTNIDSLFSYATEPSSQLLSIIFSLINHNHETSRMNSTYLYQKIAAATRPTVPTAQHAPTITKKIQIKFGQYDILNTSIFISIFCDI